MQRFLSFAAILPLLCTVLHGFELFDFEKQQLQISNLKARSEDASILDFARSRHPARTNTACKVFPTDTSWPSDGQWVLLNKTTNGALIKTIPLASPCYVSTFNDFDADKCTYITSQWSNSSLHALDPTSVDTPIWQGRTCEPPTDAPTPNGTCTLGGLPAYVINATTVSDIQAGVNFARNSGIRLVIKNTGHDFLGKSLGAGSLSIWTHYLKDIEFTPRYTGDGHDDYDGPAFKAGSGVQAFELFAAADAHNVTVVGGEARTVGVMGGYILGGGHSPLSSIYGLAADHILSLSLVLASGELITASSSQNTDLFWALRGGGGSTFGIVTSITIKAYPPLPVTSLSITFGGGGITSPQFWAGIRSYFSYLPTFTEAGTYGYSFVIPGDPPLFILSPLFAPNLTIAETQNLLAPFLSELSAIGINPAITYNHYPTYYTAWEASFPQETVGRDATYFGSRLFPRQNFIDKDSALFNATFAAWQESVNAGLVIISFAVQAPLLSSNTENAVNPAWRNTVFHSLQNVQWTAQGSNSSFVENEEVAARKLLSQRQKAWREVTPGAGAYLGESDRYEEDWQQSFYGSNYERLVSVKRSVDPGDVFWAKTAVGSEGWDVRSLNPVGDEDGPLCRV